MTANECRNPECRNPPTRRGWCSACYAYRRRTHTTRPAHLIEAHYHRTLARITPK